MTSTHWLANSSNVAVAVLFFVVLTFFSVGCEDDPGSFGLGREFVDSQTSLSLVDTFSVRLSTVILDSVVTSGTGNALIGTYRDAIFGKVTSSTYFQLGIPENHDVEEDDAYDSLALVLRYNGYFYGDTTKPYRIKVHHLVENIEPGDDEVITNNASFDFDLVPIGSIVCFPSPNGPVDSLLIKIDDNVGIDLFTKLKEGSELLADSETFRDYFHGLVLLPDTMYEGSVVGFSTNEQDIKLVLSTTRKSTSEQINWEFKLNDATKQFNNISHDLTSTQLEALVRQSDAVSSSVTGGLSFLQGGIGLSLRVDFPSLQEALLIDKVVLMAARLSIVPLQNSYGTFGLPSQMVAYESDGFNRQQEAVASSSLVVDELYQEETAYSFDITGYLATELADSYVDPEKGLLITLSTNDQGSRFYRAILDAQNRNTKLKIYYLSY